VASVPHLFLPDITDFDPRYNRYSFPNKFGTYLTAGMPVIVAGHAANSAAEILRRFPVGLFTDTANVDQMADFLRRARSLSRILGGDSDLLSWNARGPSSTWTKCALNYGGASAFQPNAACDR
jgi:hypothetical protein